MQHDDNQFRAELIREDVIIKGKEKRKKQQEVSSNLMVWNNSEDPLFGNFDLSLSDFDELQLQTVLRLKMLLQIKVVPSVLVSVLSMFFLVHPVREEFSFQMMAVLSVLVLVLCVRASANSSSAQDSFANQDLVVGVGSICATPNQGAAVGVGSLVGTLRLGAGGANCKRLHFR